MKKLFTLIAFSLTIMVMPALSQATLVEDTSSKMSVLQTVKSDGIVTFPNPNNGLFYLRMPNLSPETDITITVYDQRGNLVLTESGSGNIAIVDIVKEVPGIYTVFVAGDGVFARQRVSVIK